MVLGIALGAILGCLLSPLGTAATGGAGEALSLTTPGEPLMLHDRSGGWAESPSLSIVGRSVYVAYEAADGPKSHIYLARLPRAGRKKDVEKLQIDDGGGLETWPSLAQSGEAAGSTEGLWVAWSSYRDGKWAIRAVLVNAMKASSEIVVSKPDRLQGQVRVASGHGIACFVWTVWDGRNYRVVARTYDGQFGKPLEVYSGADPVGRPDVYIVGRDHVVFAWDEYVHGGFAIQLREMIGGKLQGAQTLAPTERADNWEPRIAGAAGNLLVSWHTVPADSTRCEPAFAKPGAVLPGPGIGWAGRDETWRVRCLSDAAGNTWLAWTTRSMYRSTKLFLKRIGPEGVGRTVSVDFPMKRNFMNTFDCRFAGDLFVAWDFSGAIYLAEVKLPDLSLESSESPGEPGSHEPPGEASSPGGEASDWSAESEDAATETEGAPGRAGRLTRSGEAYAMLYEGDSLHVYFGDCHNHTSFSDGRAYPDISLAIARDRRELDFAAITDHDVTLTPGEFAWSTTVAELMSGGTGFACLHGFEASKGWAKDDFGHWTVLFPGGGEVFPFEPGMTPPDLYRFAGRYEALTIPHHVATRFAPHNWGYFDPAAEPVVEMCSLHGIFESLRGNEGRPDMLEGKFVEDGLARGYVFGFIGGSDSHNCFEAARADQGLAGVYAESLTPEAIFEAVRKRRTFALTGGGVILDFWCNGRLMGEELEVAGGSHPGALVFTGHACSPDSIISLQIMSNRQAVYESRTSGPEVSITWEAPAPDSQAYYYLKAATSKGDFAWSSPIWIVPQR